MHGGCHQKKMWLTTQYGCLISINVGNNVSRIIRDNDSDSNLWLPACAVGDWRGAFPKKFLAIREDKTAVVLPGSYKNLKTASIVPHYYRYNQPHNLFSYVYIILIANWLHGSSQRLGYF